VAAPVGHAGDLRQHAVGLPGTTRRTLGLDGTATYDVQGARSPGATLALVVHRRGGDDFLATAQTA
jgi:hypothetical protein